jgi:hypothetical protein
LETSLKEAWEFEDQLVLLIHIGLTIGCCLLLNVLTAFGVRSLFENRDSSWRKLFILPSLLGSISFFGIAISLGFGTARRAKGAGTWLDVVVDFFFYLGIASVFFALIYAITFLGASIVQKYSK